jgi:predicted regulator of Ras-like GTPase activity (Roadblock/LC7/MglB family)
VNSDVLREILVDGEDGKITTVTLFLFVVMVMVLDTFCMLGRKRVHHGEVDDYLDTPG